MLVIRNHQKFALAADAFERYRTRLVAMLHELYPAACAERGVEAVVGLVQRASEHAQAFGLTVYGDIGKYVVLAFAMGEDFETNAAYAWVGEIVRAPNFSSPSERIREIYRQAEARLGRR